MVYEIAHFGNNDAEVFRMILGSFLHPYKSIFQFELSYLQPES